MTGIHGIDDIDHTGGMHADERGTFVIGHFESCTEFRAASYDGPCDDCGWLADDHPASGGAVVIAVPHRPTQVLRRAS